MHPTRRTLTAVGLSVLLGSVLTAGATTAGTMAKMKPVIGEPVSVPAQPVAGKRFTVSFKVTRSDTGKALRTGTMICDPSTAGKTIPHSESFKGGTARLSFVVPESAKLLTVKVTIKAAGKSATRVSSFKVTAAVIPAKLEIEKYGFGVDPFDDLTFVGYGVVLKNVSPDEDAGEVELRINAVGTAGQILASDTDWYEVVPASTTYYAGGLIMIEQGYATVARLDVSVSFDERLKKSVTLPAVSNMRVQADEFGGAEVAGDVQNSSPTKTLSNLASITAVAFDPAGNVIGGGWDSPETDVPPGGRAAFAVGIAGRSPAEVASAQVSVEPYYRDASAPPPTTPRDGAYVGKTSQSEEITFEVAGSGTIIRNLRFKHNESCDPFGHVNAYISASGTSPISPEGTWSLSGGGSITTYQFGTGTFTATVTGKLNTSGGASGTLRVDAVFGERRCTSYDQTWTAAIP